MKSTMTLTDDVTVGTVEDLRGVSDALADLITKAENFAIDGEVEQVSVSLKVNASGRTGEPDRVYAQLVVKVSSNG